MTRLKLHELFGILALAIWTAGADFEQARAQESAQYPNRLIRIVAPLPAGGNMDALSRVIAEKLSASIGQPVIIENKTGASGGIGASAVAQSKPDGYTILFAIASTIQAVGLQKNPPFKLSELAPIVQLAELPTGFAVLADLQAATLADFVKLAKAKPGDLSFGSVGTGSTGHIIGEGFAAAAGIKLLHVPYKGEAPAITDLLGGHISSAFASVGEARTISRQGQTACDHRTTPLEAVFRCADVRGAGISSARPHRLGWRVRAGGDTKSHHRKARDRDRPHCPPAGRAGQNPGLRF
jgi:tripartite-type tricarboxylate transporter receptor subunit TctC